jgi:iron-sulfur cluster assembly protein
MLTIAFIADNIYQNCDIKIQIIIIEFSAPEANLSIKQKITNKENHMLQEIETNFQVVKETTVTITPAATNAVREILAERKLEGYALRVYVAGGGCSGVQFGMALDNNTHENDMTFETDGVKVLIDDQSMNYLVGAKIDFVNDPVRGAGFLVDSPSAQMGGSCGCGGGSCGCGSSSEAHSHSESESSCGCGGNCGCGSAN